MADLLDDFFAKKDKKKGKDKARASALSAEALVRELEVGSKQLDYPDRRKDFKTSNVVELLGLDADDTDWRNFEDVEKRDYTGLKVKEMSLQDQADEEQRRLSEQIEPLPESTPWKLKSDDSHQSQQSATNPDATNKATGLNAGNPSLSSSSSSKIDAKQQDTSNSDNKTSDTSNTNAVSSATISSTSTEKISPSSAAPAASLDGAQSKSDVDKEPSSTTTPATDQPKSESKDEPKAEKPSAKYVVPQARNNTDAKVLEPIRLGKGKTNSGRSGPIPNLQDQQAFPSLG